MQYKTNEVRSKCENLMRINLYKDQIKTAGSMPPLPNDKALLAALRTAYNVLKAAGRDRARGRPMYAISEEQKKAANTLLQVDPAFIIPLLTLHASSTILPMYAISKEQRKAADTLLQVGLIFITVLLALHI